MCKLFIKEIAMHSDTEKLKQEMSAMHEFNVDDAYKAIDDWGYGFVDFNNLKRFLKSTGTIVDNK